MNTLLTRDNLKLPVSQLAMSLVCERKPEYSEKTHKRSVETLKKSDRRKTSQLSFVAKLIFVVKMLSCLVPMDPVTHLLLTCEMSLLLRL